MLHLEIRGSGCTALSQCLGVGALIIRIGFWGPLLRNQQNNIGNHIEAPILGGFRRLRNLGLSKPLGHSLLRASGSEDDAVLQNRPQKDPGHSKPKEAASKSGCTLPVIMRLGKRSYSPEPVEGFRLHHHDM